MLSKNERMEGSEMQNGSKKQTNSEMVPKMNEKIIDNKYIKCNNLKFEKFIHTSD